MSSQKVPSARPRLVEEGEPIYVHGTESTNIPQEKNGGAHPHVNYRWQQQQQQQQHYHQTTATTTTTNTFCSIGSDTVDEHDMVTSSPRQRSSLPKVTIPSSSLQRAALQSNVKVRNNRKNHTTTTTTTTIRQHHDHGETYCANPTTSKKTSTSYVIGDCSSTINNSGCQKTSVMTSSSQSASTTISRQQNLHQYHYPKANHQNDFTDAAHQFIIGSPPPSAVSADPTVLTTEQHSNFTDAAHQFTITSPLTTAFHSQQLGNHDADDDHMMIDFDEHQVNSRQRQQQQHYSSHHHHVTQTSYEIRDGGNVGGGSQQTTNSPSVTGTTLMSTLIAADRMEGVEDHSEKSEMVVIDGANVAYAYGEVNSSNQSPTTPFTRRKPEPDVRGIQVVADHFIRYGIRVLVVLPQYFWKFADTDILNDLKARGLLVPSPPADDDDAYAITIAQREDAMSQRFPHRIKPGYVLSNDMFRDAQDRDLTGKLRRWLQDGRLSEYGPGRISYTFFDNQSMNDRGEHVLDFQPNPRHPLVMRLLEASQHE